MSSSDTWTPAPFSYVTRGEVLSAGITLPIVCWIIVGARFYIRRIQKLKLGADDWLTVPACILLTGLGVCFIVGYAIGIFGNPSPVPDDVPTSEATDVYSYDYSLEAKIEFAFQLMLILCLGLIKLSILFFLRRTFYVKKRSIFNWVTIFLIVFTSCWTLGLFIWFFAACRNHLWAYWSSIADVEQYCEKNPAIPEEALIFSDLALDVIIITIPLPLIWRLHTSLSRKLAISGVFMMGLFSIAASIVRIVIYMLDLDQGYDSSFDTDQVITTMLWWSLVEAAVALMTACMPSLWFLVRFLKYPSFLSSIRSRVSSLSRRSLLRSSNSDTSSKPRSSAQHTSPMTEHNTQPTTATQFSNN